METLGSHEAIKVYWNAVAPHLQARYCHESLGTKIKIEKVGELRYRDADNAEETYDSSVDLHAEMVGGYGGGVAWGLPCSGGNSMTHYQVDPSYFAGVST